MNRRSSVATLRSIRRKNVGSAAQTSLRNERLAIDSFATGTLRFLVPAGMLLWLAVAVLRILNAPLFAFNALRVVNGVAVAFGHTIFPAGDVGPRIAGINGPIMAMVYMPAGLARTPDGAVYIGTVMAALCFFLPIAWLHRELGKRGAGGLVAWGAGLCFFLFALVLPPLATSSLIIHADAPALGFGLAACVALLFAAPRFQLPVAAALLAAAIFSKLTVLPLIVALPVYVGLARGRAAFLKMIGWQVVMGLTFAAITAIFFGAGAPIYALNVGGSLQSHWIGSLSDINGPPAEGLAAKLKILIAMADRCWREFFYIPLLTGFLAALWFNVSETRGRHFFAWFIARPWSLFLIASLLCVPPSLMARVKMGGDVNTLSPCLFFAVAALSTLLHEMAGLIAFPELLKATRWLLVLLMFSLSLSSLHWLYELSWPLKNRAPSLHAQAYQYLLKHPGEAYFPELPLVHLLAENKLYHVWSTVVEFYYDAHRLSQAQFLSAIPPNPKRVILFVGGGGPFSVYFPGYVAKPGVPELPGAVVFERP